MCVRLCVCERTLASLWPRPRPFALFVQVLDARRLVRSQPNDVPHQVASCPPIPGRLRGEPLCVPIAHRRVRVFRFLCVCAHSYMCVSSVVGVYVSESTRATRAQQPNNTNRTATTIDTKRLHRRCRTECLSRSLRFCV